MIFKFINDWARLNGRLLCWLVRQHHGSGFGLCRRCGVVRYGVWIVAGANTKIGPIPIIQDDKQSTITLGAILQPIPSGAEYTIASVEWAQSDS